MNKAEQIKANRNILFKIIIFSLVVSSLAVIIGFFGTHYILKFNKPERENHFINEIVLSVRLMEENTQYSLEEIVEKVTAMNNQQTLHRGPRFDLKVIKKEESTFNLPAKIGTVLLLEERDLGPGPNFKDQIYNYDGESFLFFKFDHPMKSAMKPGFSNGENSRPPLPPFLMTTVVTFVIMVLIILASLIIVFWMYRGQAREAKDVLRSLKSGDLKARFSITKFDEASELMVEFNLMASEIEKLVQDLRDTDYMRRKLLQELAHDLRTPLASLKSLQENLYYHYQKMDDQKRKETIELAQKEVDYFQYLVEDLLFLSGVHDLNYRAKFDRVDLIEILQHEVKMISGLRPDIRLDIILPDEVVLKSDARLIQRLVKNALSNSIENAKSYVRVEFSKASGDPTLIVSNDGDILSDEELKTFGKKKFSRMVETHKNGRISIGLGAVIMNKICEILMMEMSIHNNGNEQSSGINLRFTWK